jgi:hypothetical protein
MLHPFPNRLRTILYDNDYHLQYYPRIGGLSTKKVCLIRKIVGATLRKPQHPFNGRADFAATPAAPIMSIFFGCKTCLTNLLPRGMIVSKIFYTFGRFPMSLTWFSWVFVSLYAVLLALIVTVLVSLKKRGDERSQWIKTKAMSAAFIGSVLILLFESARSMAGGDAETNPLLVLAAVSFIYFVALLVYKRKYGDLG